MNFKDVAHDHSQAMDFGDTIVHECVCGSNMFNVVCVFDDYEIASYLLDMNCVFCGSRYKAPTELDREEY